MTNQANHHSMFDKIDIHLIRVLNTVLLERSVSRAAIRLGMHQPAVSAALKRLRLLAGDPILVRSGSGMVPTDAGLRMIEPSARILQAAGLLFSDAKGFDPATAQVTFRLAASDYLNPLFLPQLVAMIKAQAPACRIDIQPLSADSDYRAHLAQGRVDIVVGNWSAPPDDLHLGSLFSDEVVCLVAKNHPAARHQWQAKGAPDAASWLGAEHIAPTATFLGAKGVIDEHLNALGLTRNIMVRCPHFGLMPSMVASSLLVMTTGRQYCERFANLLPLAIVPCPVPFPRMMYYQLWHERTHTSIAAKWLRERVKAAAASLQNK